MAKTEVVFSRLHKETVDDIKKICKETNDTPSRIFRDLLITWLKEQKKKKKKDY